MCAYGCICVQIKGTVLLMPNGSDLVTSAPLQTIQTDKKVRRLPSSKAAAAYWVGKILTTGASFAAVMIFQHTAPVSYK